MVMGRPCMMALGLRQALFRKATATAPKCSSLVPNSCMWRRAFAVRWIAPAPTGRKAR